MKPSEHVLIVDDDAEIRDYLELALGVPTVAVDTQEAALKAPAPAVALVDLLLGEGDTLPLVTRLSATCPVVVMTGLAADAALVRQAQAAGAVAVLHKPFALKQIRELVHTLLAERLPATQHV